MPETTKVLLWTMMGPSFISSNWLAAFPTAPTRYEVAGTGDFNGDGKPDLVLTNSTSHTLRLMNGMSVIKDVVLTGSLLVSTAEIAGVGDFSGSGQADILWRDYTGGTNFIWFMNGTNYYCTEQLLSETDRNWRIEGVGDFNGDGVSDIAWRHSITGSNRVWLMSSYPSTSYTNVALPPLTNLLWTIGGPK